MINKEVASLVWICLSIKLVVKLSFFITEVSNIIAEINDNFSHDHFELLHFILAQKLTILEGGLHWWPFCNFRFSLMNCLILLQKSMTIFYKATL